MLEQRRKNTRLYPGLWESHNQRSTHPSPTKAVSISQHSAILIHTDSKITDRIIILGLLSVTGTTTVINDQ